MPGADKHAASNTTLKLGDHALLDSGVLCCSVRHSELAWRPDGRPIFIFLQEEMKNPSAP